MMLTMTGRTTFLLSLPERLVRSVFALVGGGVHETAELLLPRLVRRSRLYEATAKNLLRVSIELVGGVDAAPGAADEYEPDPKRLAVRKTAGNAVELGSIAAFGFSPLWLLAAGADVTRGTRVYLDAFVRELEVTGVLAPGTQLGTVDELLAALEGSSGSAARLIDIPPLELAALRRSLAELRQDASGLPAPPEMAALFDGLRAQARRERRNLLDVSTGVGIAFFNSARHVGRQHLLDPYGEDLKPVRDEGFGAYAARVARPYGSAVARHFDPERRSLTERGIARVRGQRLKRAPSLEPLSREHHHELSLARGLRRAAKAPPDERLAAAAAYSDHFFGTTLEHFRVEEEIVFPAYVRQGGASAVLDRILQEHMELRGLALEVRAQVAAGEIAPETLTALGTLLRDHVRLEERELFEEIQLLVPDDELRRVEASI